MSAALPSLWPPITDELMAAESREERLAIMREAALPDEWSEATREAWGAMLDACAAHLASWGSDVPLADKQDASDAYLAAMSEVIWAAQEDEDRLTERQKERDAVERERTVLTAREEATIRRAVDLLKERGPLTASEIEALRRPGLSNNKVRPILRLAVERGLVKRVQDGHRMYWVAVREEESPT